MGNCEILFSKWCKVCYLVVTLVDPVASGIVMLKGCGENDVMPGVDLSWAVYTLSISCCSLLKCQGEG